ncbi:conserved hypothetical protein [Tenacibaculum dicentrarchi]|uniref:Uncharacterized protein n=1 Tax=Tenacibaculum dicentrarchi TaxID=669041 RepID=A0ABP1EK84_9FLAO|nr:conserved hypothetical protein [Tenacibaculum dicentrarchi]
MKLTKNIHINKYRILADYKVKVSKSPFMSVLQLANEKGGILTPDVLYDQLMQPLAIKACENLLERLTSMNYFEAFFKYDLFDETEKKFHELTSFGEQSIETKDFYDKRNGLLEIWVAHDNEFTPNIVMIKELTSDKDKNNETNKIEKINNELKRLINNTKIISLKNNAFTIDEIESQIEFLESSYEKLSITLENNNSKIELAGFIKHKKENKQEVIASILINKFHNNYLPKENILLKDFNNQDISLIRNIKIEEPRFIETDFDSITIPNIKVSPKYLEDAKKWFEALLKQRVNRYFLSDEEFNQFENDIANKFELYKNHLINSINRQQLIEIFEEEDFYKKTKLETIDYLNY